jgi:hypothetical protein
MMNWLGWIPLNLAEWIVFDTLIVVVAGVVIVGARIIGKKIDGQLAFGIAMSFVFSLPILLIFIGALGVGFGWWPPMSQWCEPWGVQRCR